MGSLFFIIRVPSATLSRIVDSTVDRIGRIRWKSKKKNTLCAPFKREAKLGKYTCEFKRKLTPIERRDYKPKIKAIAQKMRSSVNT